VGRPEGEDLSDRKRPSRRVIGNTGRGPRKGQSL
jgi:hypothetical protein